MKKEKMSFFKKMFLVLTDFRSYPFLIKYEKFYKSFLYLIELVLLVSIILTVNVCEKINNAIVEIIENYDKVIPEFELADGVLDVKSLYNQEIDDNSYLAVDTNYTYEEYKKTNEYSKLVIYDSVILVNKDKITIENLGYPLEGIPTFKEIEMNTDKNGLYEIIKEAYSNTKYKTQAISTIFVSVYFSYFIATFIKILFLALIISFICLPMGVMLNFKNYTKIAIYAYTLPLIIDVIATCLVGFGKDYTYYTTLALTYVYIIYAIRAIRLDAFIMMFSQNVKSKNTPTGFEEELKKYNELINGDSNKTDSKQDEDKKE